MTALRPEAYNACFSEREQGRAVSYAVIATGGKQHKVAVGDRLRVERIDAGVGEAVTLGEVLAVQTSEGLLLGRPTVSGAKVVARVVAQGKAKKILVFKKKKRKQYRRTRGHRQDFTSLLVEEIHLGPAVGERG